MTVTFPPRFLPIDFSVIPRAFIPKALGFFRHDGLTLCRFGYIITIYRFDERKHPDADDLSAAAAQQFSLWTNA